MAEASAVLNPSGVAWWPLARQKQRGNGIAWSIPVKIAIIGGGYVGLVSGACFAEFGVSVDIFEADPVKRGMLLEGKIPIYEPGLDRLVADNAAAGRLSFPARLEDGIAGAEAIFIAVGTPARRGDGHADLTYVFAAVEQVVLALDHPAIIVTKSTVPVGTGRKIAELAHRLRPELAIEVASNPEFLREGSAIPDFMRPDRVVVGADSDRAREVLRRLYRPLYLIETPIVFTGLETAELIKYAANGFLAMKITFINEMADLCESVGADVNDVARGIGLDGRIGRKFLHAGPGFGGSCFPKDTLALMRIAEEAGTPSRLIQSVVSVNDTRKESMAARVIAACGGSVAGQRVAVLGLAFKPETDDMREAPSLPLVRGLLEAGAEVAAFDPVAMQSAKNLLPAGVIFTPDAAAALTGADALVLVTEWNEFRSLAPARLAELMRQRVIVDLRNVFDQEAMRGAGFAYYGIGRKQLNFET
jgi:UDPglucose 6-dehydrogenase